MNTRPCGSQLKFFNAETGIFSIKHICIHMFLPSSLLLCEVQLVTHDASQSLGIALNINWYQYLTKS